MKGTGCPLSQAESPSPLALNGVLPTAAVWTPKTPYSSPSLPPSPPHSATPVRTWSLPPPFGGHLGPVFARAPLSPTTHSYRSIDQNQNKKSKLVHVIHSLNPLTSSHKTPKRKKKITGTGNRSASPLTEVDGPHECVSTKTNSQAL